MSLQLQSEGWSWSLGHSWKNGEQNTGNGQNGYSFPLLWSFIFHFCESQYIVETFPIHNQPWLSFSSLHFSLFSFLETVRGRRLKTIWHGTFLPFYFLIFFLFRSLSFCLRIEEKRQKRIRPRDRKDRKFCFSSNIFFISDLT